MLHNFGTMLRNTIRTSAEWLMSNLLQQGVHIHAQIIGSTNLKSSIHIRHNYAISLTRMTYHSIPSNVHQTDYEEVKCPAMSSVECFPVSKMPVSCFQLQE